MIWVNTLIHMIWADIHSDHIYLDTLGIPLNSTLRVLASYGTKIAIFPHHRSRTLSCYDSIHDSFSIFSFEAFIYVAFHS